MTRMPKGPTPLLTAACDAIAEWAERNSANGATALASPKDVSRWRRETSVARVFPEGRLNLLGYTVVEDHTVAVGTLVLVDESRRFLGSVSFDATREYTVERTFVSRCVQCASCDRPEVCALIKDGTSPCGLNKTVKLERQS